MSLIVNHRRLPAVLWFTGLSGAGKTTIASAVVRELLRRGVQTEYLDGDAVRLLSPTGFTRADRDAHVKRVGFLASRLEHHGITVVCALISPYEEARQYVRELCARFIEIHVATPLAECERRDVKGLYQRARRGEISHFTGISDPYEVPRHPELVIDTTGVTVDEAARRVLQAWEAAGAAPVAVPIAARA
jgi:adenylylsulfate kinase